MEQLYKDLMALQIPGDFSKFFYKDFTSVLGTKCRIFSYNFAAYLDWCCPSALESRGIMFEIDEDNNPVRIMARPMEKFFNLGETPFTMNLELDNGIEYAMSKEDGSLISTYHDQGILFTKSKASLTSSQAIESKQLLLDVRYRELAERALELALKGYTCNFEYVAPNNRIVLSYEEKALVLLNIRENDTGNYVPIGEIKKDPILRQFMVEVFPPRDDVSTDELIAEIRKMTDIEGFVFQHTSGIKFKLKTEWYSNLHRMKDTLNNNEALFMVVAGGGSDDIKSIYTDDYSRTKIETFETVFLNYLEESSKYVFEMHRSLIGSDRKTYAVASQTTLKLDNKLELFGILMKMFDGFDSEETINAIVGVFVKNSKKFIPDQYLILKETDI